MIRIGEARSRLSTFYQQRDLLVIYIEMPHKKGKPTEALYSEARGRFIVIECTLKCSVSENDPALFQLHPKT